jgi:hypothetical protein
VRHEEDLCKFRVEIQLVVTFSRAVFVLFLWHSCSAAVLALAEIEVVFLHQTMSDRFLHLNLFSLLWSFVKRKIALLVFVCVFPWSWRKKN